MLGPKDRAERNSNILHITIHPCLGNTKNIHPFQAFFSVMRKAWSSMTPSKQDMNPIELNAAQL